MATVAISTGDEFDRLTPLFGKPTYPSIIQQLIHSLRVKLEI